MGLIKKEKIQWNLCCVVLGLNFCITQYGDFFFFFFLKFYY